MNARRSFILSLTLNFTLATIAFVMWRNTSAPVNTPSLVKATKTSASTARVITNAPPLAVTVSNAAFNWSMIESDDYRRYVSNLQAVGCPERTIRDIIVADIDALYTTKTNFAAPIPPPWQNADARRAQRRERMAKIAALRAEKRALVKELIGYEWDSHVNEEWHEDFFSGLLLGFLPYPKPLHLAAIAKDYQEQAEDIKAAANYILIDEDRARLRQLYEARASEFSQLISPSERDELELRIQAMEFQAEGNFSLEGITLSGAELREYIRLSKGFRDPARDIFLQPPELSDAELAARKEAFDEQVGKLFGPERYAEYQRRQDTRYRESCAFAQQYHLGKTVGASVFDFCRTAEQQAAQIKADASLSADERASALAVLKIDTTGKVKSTLGDAYQEYLAGPGRWLGNLDAKPKGNPP